MEENELGQPAETLAATAPVEGGRIAEGHSYLDAALGCFSAFLLAYALSMGSFAVLALAGADVIGLSVGVSASAPVAGLSLWWFFRRSRPWLARGALVFAVVTFALFGTCWIVDPPSPEKFH